jgi:hypothetical protein
LFNIVTLQFFLSFISVFQFQEYVIKFVLYTA